MSSGEANLACKPDGPDIIHSKSPLFSLTPGMRARSALHAGRSGEGPGVGGRLSAPNAFRTRTRTRVILSPRG